MVCSDIFPLYNIHTLSCWRPNFSQYNTGLSVALNRKGRCISCIQTKRFKIQHLHRVRTKLRGLNQAWIRPKSSVESMRITTRREVDDLLWQSKEKCVLSLTTVFPDHVHNLSCQTRFPRFYKTLHVNHETTSSPILVPSD